MKKSAVLIFSMLLVFSLTCLDNALSKEQSPEKKAKKQSITKDVKKQSNIEGIGNFKIGKTKIDIMKDLESEFGTQIETTSGDYDLYKMKGKKNSIFQIIPEQENSIPPSLCPDFKQYYIPVYIIADMTITELKLNFYKDILSSIECDSSEELVEALELKYGKPESKIDKKSVSCFYKHTGNKVTLEEISIYSDWYNKDINAHNAVMSFYSSKCEPLFAKKLYIYDSNISKTIFQCDQDIRQRTDDSKKRERLKNLKGF